MRWQPCSRIGVDRHGRIAEFHMTGVVDAGVVRRGPRRRPLAFAQIELVDHVLRDQAGRAGAAARGVWTLSRWTRADGVPAASARACGRRGWRCRNRRRNERVQHGCSLLRRLRVPLTRVTGRAVRCETLVAAEPISSAATEPRPREPCGSRRRGYRAATLAMVSAMGPISVCSVQGAARRVQQRGGFAQRRAIRAGDRHRFLPGSGRGRSCPPAAHVEQLDRATGS